MLLLFSLLAIRFELGTLVISPVLRVPLLSFGQRRMKVVAVCAAAQRGEQSCRQTGEQPAPGRHAGQRAEQVVKAICVYELLPNFPIASGETHCNGAGQALR